MAGRTRSLSAQSAEISEFMCKHCSKKVLNKVKCSKCDHVFHPACLKQSAVQKNPECRHEVDNPSNNKDEFLTETNFLKEENILLKQIIKDKDTIISDKDFLIELLRDKISLLENKQQNHQFLENIQMEIKNISMDSSQKTIPKNTNIAGAPANGIVTNVNVVSKQGHSNNAVVDSRCTDIEGDATSLEKQLASNIMEIQTKQKCNQIINLENDNEDVDSQDFTKVRRRRKKTMEGSGNGDDNFYGRQNNEKKIWLFITRIPDRINENNIENYIKSRTDSNNITVKKLHTRSSRKDNQSFLIGVEPHLKQQIYESNFWPKKVVYDRFNFKRGQHFLQNGQTLHTEEHGRPNSFL